MQKSHSDRAGMGYIFSYMPYRWRKLVLKGVQVREGDRWREVGKRGQLASEGETEKESSCRGHGQLSSWVIKRPVLELSLYPSNCPPLFELF